MSQQDLAIIIVSWNVRDLLFDCLTSVFAEITNNALAAAVWVVDNHSHDDSATMVAEKFPQVNLLASETNLGFAGGNNAALRAMHFPDKHPDQPQAVLLLNPDTLVSPNSLNVLITFLKANEKVGLMGANLFYEDGSFQHSAFHFPGVWQLAIELFPLPGRLYASSLNGRYPADLYEGQAPFPIEHPLGAAMLVRREAIHQVGIMDETYHMYVEEVDWSWRIKAAGWQAYCHPMAHITHLEGQSTSQIKTQSMINLWHSRYQFYKKYYKGLKFWLAQTLVIKGMQRKIHQTPEYKDTYVQIQAIWRGQTR